MQRLQSSHLRSLTEWHYAFCVAHTAWLGVMVSSFSALRAGFENGRDRCVTFAFSSLQDP